MFDALLFDNDGVLVDTEALYFRANREALATVGVELDEEALAGKIGHDWKNPEAYDKDDGSVMDW